MSDGRSSLYLDFYPPIEHPQTGKPTRREFLRLYTFDKARKGIEKDHNRETLALADNIRAQRQLAIQQQQYGFLSRAQRETCFVAYFETLARKRKDGNAGNWLGALEHLHNFTGGTLKMKDLTVAKADAFKAYLLSAKRLRSDTLTLEQNTALSYFNKFKAALKQAYKDELLPNDLNAKVEPIKLADTHREYLTLAELQTLAQTDCPDPILKRAGLFSALTGLRFSDIAKLIWAEVRTTAPGEHGLQFRQEKTDGAEVLPISEQTYGLLGEPGKLTDKVFPGLKYSSTLNTAVKQWVKSAGITKHITFHCFRHTFATLQLLHGSDIYTVSKMLGHRELKTTQVYAKVADESKRKTVNRIKIDL
jgi:integrase